MDNQVPKWMLFADRPRDVLRQKAIYGIPNYRWMMLCLLSFSAFLAAVNYQKNILYWLTYTCWTLTLYSVLYAYYKLKTLDVQWHLPERLFQGTSWTLQSNLDHLPGMFITPASTEKGLSMVYTRGPYQIESLEPGEFQWQPMYWVSQYPLGLFTLRVRMPSMSARWVYPQPINHLALEPKTRKTHAPSPAQDTLSDPSAWSAGYSRRRVLKKTQALPPPQWRIQKWATRDEDDEKESLQDHAFSWETLPTHWTTQQKIQQLSYFVEQTKETEPFSITLPNGQSVALDKGAAQKDRAWRALTQLWMQSV